MAFKTKEDGREARYTQLYGPGWRDTLRTRLGEDWEALIDHRSSKRAGRASFSPRRALQLISDSLRKCGPDTPAEVLVGLVRAYQSLTRDVKKQRAPRVPRPAPAEPSLEELIAEAKASQQPSGSHPSQGPVTEATPAPAPPRPVPDARTLERWMAFISEPAPIAPEGAPVSQPYTNAPIPPTTPTPRPVDAPYTPPPLPPNSVYGVSHFDIQERVVYREDGTPVPENGGDMLFW